MLVHPEPAVSWPRPSTAPSAGKACCALLSLGKAIFCPISLPEGPLRVLASLQDSGLEPGPGPGRRLQKASWAA